MLIVLSKPYRKKIFTFINKEYANKLINRNTPEEATELFYREICLANSSAGSSRDWEFTYPDRTVYKLRDFRRLYEMPLKYNYQNIKKIIIGLD